MPATSHVTVGLAVLLVASAFGCSEGSTTARTPSAPAATDAPSSPPNSLGFLAGFVVDKTGKCIDRATVEIITGRAVGDRVTQITPCSVWDYDGGFVFNDLEPAVAVTLRAAAPGYQSAERTFFPLARTQYRLVSIVLASLPPR